MHIHTSKGFTLVELLVVIALIGIIATLALSALNTARDKGADGAAIESLNNARAQADLYYSENGNAYTSVCAMSKSATLPGIRDHLTAADSANGTGVVNCFDESEAGIAEGWAMEAQLVQSTTTYFCTDYTGLPSVPPVQLLVIQM